MFELYSDGDGRISEESMLTMLRGMYRMYYQNSYDKEVQRKVDPHSSLFAILLLLLLLAAAVL
jgi:hypothetical protein